MVTACCVSFGAVPCIINTGAPAHTGMLPHPCNSSKNICLQEDMRLSWTPCSFITVNQWTPTPQHHHHHKICITLCPLLQDQTPCSQAELRSRPLLLGTAPPSAGPQRSRPWTPTGQRPPSGPGSAAAVRSPRMQPRSAYVQHLIKEKFQRRTETTTELHSDMRRHANINKTFKND